MLVGGVLGCTAEDDVEDLAKKIAFLEARVTLLERKLAHKSQTYEALDASAGTIDIVPEPVRLACNSPGLMISRMYLAEWDENGVEFCWVGNEGPIQFVLPIRPIRPLRCRLHLQPHPRVTLSAAVAVVNDEECVTNVAQEKHDLSVGFDVQPSSSPNINILLLGVDSVRPSDYGENSDHRLLAARFFGVDVIFS